jgi:hypothetical protein
MFLDGLVAGEAITTIDDRREAALRIRFNLIPEASSVEVVPVHAHSHNSVSRVTETFISWTAHGVPKQSDAQ